MGLVEGLSDNTSNQPATVVIETMPSGLGLTPPISLPGASDTVSSNVWDVTGGVVSFANFDVTDISSAFELSLIYFPGGDHLGDIQDVAGATLLRGRLTIEQTPLPAALPLFATGLGAMGLFGWRRKRKNAAALAA
jgi:hypothetical protein